MRAVFVLTGALALGGCQTTGLSLSTVKSGIAEARTAAVVACGFLPTAATVANILSADPNIATAEAVAGAVCAAVNARAKAVAVAGTTVPVSGSPVK